MSNYTTNTASKWSQVKLLICDFDGVFTDDAVYVDQDGRESVRCLRADGYGITLLQAAGVPVIVLSAEVNPVVAERCAKLGVSCDQGVTDKVAKLREICKWVPLSEVAYMGNDVNDLECLKAVGFPIVVRNAEKAVFRQICGTDGPEFIAMDGWRSSHIVMGVHITQRSGGYGAVREVCDLILDARREHGLG